MSAGKRDQAYMNSVEYAAREEVLLVLPQWSLALHHNDCLT